MKKLLLLLILSSCSYDYNEKPKDPCCVLVDDPFTHQRIVNDTVIYTTRFNGIHQCDTIVEQMSYQTIYPHHIPVQGECFENR